MKDLLLKYPAMTKKVYEIRKEIKEARESANALRESTKTVVLSDMPKGSGLSDDTYNKAQKIIDSYDKRINNLLYGIEQVQKEQARITDLLRDLSPDEFKVIEARYILGIRWDFVPGKVNYNRRHCFRLHDRAIKKMLAKI